MNTNENTSLLNQDALVKAISVAFQKVILENKHILAPSLSQESIPADVYFSQKEACAFLSIHQSTIIRWRKQNLVPYHRIGKAIMYSKNELVLFARTKVNWK